MSKVRAHIPVLLDGYVAGPNQSQAEPPGDGGERLHDWVFELKAWREPHGIEGGEDNASTNVVAPPSGRGARRDARAPVERW